VADFAAVKALLDDGKVSHLDALRLNNDFRRIGPERARIVSRELATAATQLAFYESALNDVELALINGSRDDRLQNEDLLERLPAPRRSEAQADFASTEASHLKLLERKRLALEKLAARAEETHRQIERRLKTLDDQYGFIRTNIFWVRDQEPISAVTLAQCRREAVLLGRSLLPLVQEACDRSLWGRVSPEFAVAAVLLIVLPWPLVRLRSTGLRRLT
jgi:potassium efflux system protein